ncbi:MAG: hypothetical protein ACFFC6_07010 [Promethearchaeota archaeon]
MNKEILTHKMKIFCVILLSLVFIILIEGLVTLNDYTGILKIIIVAPINLARYIPVIILLCLLSADMVQIFNNCNSELQFEVKKTGVVFFQDFNIWLAIFETFSVEKIETSELKQLKHLETFSLEIDRRKMGVRVILYSKSAKQLEKRIRTSKPILEVVLPDIKLISKEDIINLYSRIELLKIGKYHFFKERSELFYPQFSVFPKKISHSISRIILACNILDEVSNDEFMNSTQLYFFHRFDQTSFFKYINQRFFKSPSETATHFQSNQELQRVRLSYQINKKPFLSFQEGLDQFIRFLSFTSFEPKITKTEERQSLSPFETNQQEVISATETTSFVEMNQICSELCNLPKEKKHSNEEKVKRCKRRADFCLNLLENANFSSILDSLIRQENIIDQIHLISELRRHLTYHQIICCFSHLSKHNYPQIPHTKLVNLIHVLFRSIDETNEVLDSNKKFNSSILFTDGNNDQVSPSLTPN